MSTPVTDDDFDAEADAAIGSCLNVETPKSFFLYAGAGSGKTRSLVEAVRAVCQKQGHMLSRSAQKIAVITYTNAACDEIRQRLEYDPRVAVSTIHAFAWSLISGYDNDIRKWVSVNLEAQIAELQQQQAKGRPGKASTDRARSIVSKQKRLASLGGIRRFVYSPTSDNRTRDSLNHAEVIAMTSDFLTLKAGLQNLLTNAYPIVLIDESQDTARLFMDAMLHVQQVRAERFGFGLFGDTMQRIYADGKARLAEAIPANWARPRKRINHRCPTRVVTLINKVRADDDGQEQQPRSGAIEGFARVFLASTGVDSFARLETKVLARMSAITGDGNWEAGGDKVKTLALEHLMSARRFGFDGFFAPLYGFDWMRTSLLEGSGRSLGFFTREILPLANALAVTDRFAIAAIVRKTSPILARDRLETAGEDQRSLLQEAKSACDGLRALLFDGPSPSLRSVLEYVAKTNLFAVPDALVPFMLPDERGDGDDAGADLDAEDAKSETGAWRLALDASFDQIEKYDHYVRGLSQFDTHQGVKGLEFSRVMVIINDDEARGFMFNYGKLIGTQARSKTDLENEAAGIDSSVDRTRRLFYVTCSRSKQSLAVVCYTNDPHGARQQLVSRGWFAENEIELIS